MYLLEILHHHLTSDSKPQKTFLFTRNVDVDVKMSVKIRKIDQLYQDKQINFNFFAGINRFNLNNRLISNLKNLYIINDNLYDMALE